MSKFIWFFRNCIFTCISNILNFFNGKWNVVSLNSLLIFLSMVLLISMSPNKHVSNEIFIYLMKSWCKISLSLYSYSLNIHYDNFSIDSSMWFAQSLPWHNFHGHTLYSTWKSFSPWVLSPFRSNVRNHLWWPENLLKFSIFSSKLMSFFLKKGHDKHANKQQVKQNQVTSEKCKQNILIASWSNGYKKIQVKEDIIIQDCES